MKNLALSLPGFEGKITPPPNIPTGSDAPSNVLQYGISFILLAVITAALIFTIYGGVLWVTSQGDKQKLDKARRTITFAIVGLIVAVFAFTIINVMGQLLGIRFLQTFGGAPATDTGGIQGTNQCRAAGGYCDPGSSCTAGNPVGNCGPSSTCCK